MFYFQVSAQALFWERDLHLQEQELELQVRHVRPVSYFICSIFKSLFFSVISRIEMQCAVRRKQGLVFSEVSLLAHLVGQHSECSQGQAIWVHANWWGQELRSHLSLREGLPLLAALWPQNTHCFSVFCNLFLESTSSGFVWRCFCRGMS